MIQKETGRAVPRRSDGAALGRHRRGVRELEHPPRDRLPEAARHPRHDGHRGQRGDHGVRQPGRGLRHRRRLHAGIPSTGERVLYGEYLLNAQGEDVVSGTRDVEPIAPAPGQPCRSLHQELDRMARTLERHFRDVQDMEFTIERGQAVHAADPPRPALGPCRGPGRVRDGGRGADHRGGGGRPDSAQRSQSAAAPDHRPQGAPRSADHRPPGLTRGRLRHRGVRRRRGRAAGAPGRGGDSGAAGDLSRGLPRHGDGQGDPHGPGRHDLARGGGGARDGQAVRGGRPGDRGRRGDEAASRSTADRSPRATGSRWTGVPGGSTPGRPRWCHRS